MCGTIGYMPRVGTLFSTLRFFSHDLTPRRTRNTPRTVNLIPENNTGGERRLHFPTGRHMGGYTPYIHPGRHMVGIPLYTHPGRHMVGVIPYYTHPGRHMGELYPIIHTQGGICEVYPVIYTQGGMLVGVPGIHIGRHAGRCTRDTHTERHIPGL